MGLMLFVNHVGHEPAWIPHAAWDGLHLAGICMHCVLMSAIWAMLVALVCQQMGGDNGDPSNKPCGAEENEGLSTIADTVMPCFLLLVGLSAALSLTSQRQRGMSRSALFGRCLQRAGVCPQLGTLPNSEKHAIWGDAS